MKAKYRIALWFLGRKLAALYKKGLKMKPLPKWIAWLGNLSAIGAGLAVLGHAIPGTVGVVIAGLAAVINSIAHSLPGTGGTPANP